jgi:large subunit ribosomal protein L17
MRHNVSGRSFSRPTSHRVMMYRNLVTDLLRYEKIVTTEAKAKEVRGFAERMITLGKDGTLHSRREVLSFLNDKQVADKLFKEIAPKYAQRAGGYVRIVRIGQRAGDAAPTAQLELVK